MFTICGRGNLIRLPGRRMQSLTSVLHNARERKLQNSFNLKWSRARILYFSRAINSRVDVLVLVWIIVFIMRSDARRIIYWFVVTHIYKWNSSAHANEFQSLRNIWWRCRRRRFRLPARSCECVNARFRVAIRIKIRNMRECVVAHELRDALTQ